MGERTSKPCGWEEVILWDSDEPSAVVREREAHPNYEVTVKSEAELAAERWEARAAQLKEQEEENERAKKAARLKWELLENESKWREL